MLAEYKQMVSVIGKHVDLFICETMTTITEAKAASKACAGQIKPIWIAYTLADDLNDNQQPTLRDGTVVSKDITEDLDCDALLFNCCQAEIVLPALQIMKENTDLKLGAYANGFEHIPQNFTYGNVEEIGRR